MQQGHMRSVKQGIRSTKTRKKDIIVKQADGSQLTTPLRKHHDVYGKIEEAKETIYTDQLEPSPPDLKVEADT